MSTKRIDFDEKIREMGGVDNLKLKKISPEILKEIAENVRRFKEQNEKARRISNDIWYFRMQGISEPA